MKFTVVILLSVLSSPVFAGKVLLVWDPNPPSENVLSYGIYEHDLVRKTYVYYGQVATNRAVVLDVPVGDRCFVVTALNEFGESSYSEPACVRVDSASLAARPHLDLQAPNAAVLPLPQTSSAQIPLEWAGQDEEGGSGVAGYDVYVSVNDGPFQLWMNGAKLTSDLYPGQPGNRYGFYCVATDRAGNRSPGPGSPQARTTTVWNTPPRLEEGQTVEVDTGAMVILPSRAVDLDLPLQKLRYSLEGAEGLGARVDPEKGTFYWQPGGLQSSQTNYFTLRVADDFTPSLSSTQRITVVVRDYLEVTVGSATVMRGNSAALPVTVFSSVPNWSLLFALDIPAGGGEEVIFEPVAGQVCAIDTWQEGPGRWWVAMSNCGGDWRKRREVVGTLHVIFSAPRSAFVPLVVQHAVGSRQPGSWDPEALIPKVGRVSGRIVAVQEEPLLEAKPTDGRSVTLRLYGVPGLNYAVDVNTSAADPRSWSPNWQGTLTSESKDIVIPAKWANRLFFRARSVP